MENKFPENFFGGRKQTALLSTGFVGRAPSSPSNKTRDFPADFLWGSATSAHQVEGGNRNNWTEWERENAKRKAKSAKERSWPNFILKNYPNPLQEENYISGRACDHYNRFREDFDIAKQLSHNAHRFSVEWSRIEPEEGKFNETEIEHYGEVIRALRERGLEPFVTLWHWTMPLWLYDKGGVLSEKFPEYFERYTRYIVSAFKTDVHFWITINEPEIYSLNSYLCSIWPPQKRGIVNYYRALTMLICAHRRVQRVIKSVAPSAQVGVSINLSYFESAGGPVNALLKWGADRLWNFHFLNHTKQFLDFIGLNYYFHNRIDYGFNKNKNKKISDMGWELYPEGIYYVLCDLQHYKKPIYITENGLADARDERRGWFIEETLKNVRRAMTDGADVRGYFYWSLLDNFEWDKGFWPRFGLVEVDYRTMERRIRQSAWAYKKIIDSLLY